MATSDSTSEEALIGTYFSELSCFSYDKARELVDKEKEINKAGVSNGNNIWQSLVASLSVLTTLEKNYTSLVFLTPKRFLRADNSLKSQYESLKGDLLKLGELNKVGSNASSSNSSLGAAPSIKGFFLINPTGSSVPLPSNDSHNHDEKLFIHLGEQLASFVSARLDIIDFYEKLYMSASNRFIPFEELHNEIKSLTKKNQKQFHHPLLGPIKTVYSLETEILCLLIEAQVCIAKWKFYPSLINLFESHCKLGSWSTMFNQRETKKLSFLKPTVIPPLFQWLLKLKGSLLSKFTLYFHDVLAKQTTSQEMKSMCTKASTDYFQKILSFHKRWDAQCICLIFEAKFNDGFGIYPGYKHPHRKIESPKGLDSYPAIFSYPTKSLCHWPNLLMIMSNSYEELHNTERVVSFFDKQVNVTYFVARVEPGMTLVVIFENHKSDKDNNVILFMQDVVMQLRGNKLFLNLKPGSK